MTIVRTFAVAVAVLCGPWASHAQDAPAPPATPPAASAPPSTPSPAAAPPTAPAAPDDEEFIPSQEISADEAVTFPVDI